MSEKQKKFGSSVTSILDDLEKADYSYFGDNEKVSAPVEPQPVSDAKPEAVLPQKEPEGKRSEQKAGGGKKSFRPKKKSSEDDVSDGNRSHISLGRTDYEELTAAVYAFRVVTGKKLSYGKLISLLLNESLPKSHPEVYKRIRLILGNE